ncbi:uncharacterized protein LOC121266367 isoform X2 [Juglans microcarpa x Juglans regia]|uniref:uncharacterized protein LOC121266367 isoform X2 n=1 Tax=Juglans microcarpa x Juglans regia TaxID=2249226 RepID=UPI001B7DF38E|nr:uncharacterized protein LOC121266367 isoform X2 [Juglans microcarpa x Juglans regia]
MLTRGAYLSACAAPLLLPMFHLPFHLVTGDHFQNAAKRKSPSCCVNTWHQWYIIPCLLDGHKVGSDQLDIAKEKYITRHT